MIGDAKLILSRENIVEAVQQWLDKQWTVDSPVVTDVCQMISGNNNKFQLELTSNKSFVGVDPA